MRKFLITTALVTSLAASVNAVNAAAVCFTGCTASGETKIFFSKNPSTTDDISGIGGHVGHPGVVDIDFFDTTKTNLDFADGFATIKPAKGLASFSNLDVEIPNHTFTDLDYSFKLEGAKNQGTYTALVYGIGNKLLGSHTYDHLKVNANLDFLITSSIPIQKIVFDAPAGFGQARQVQTSGVALAPTPVPALGLIGFGPIVGATLLALRRRKRQQSGASAMS